MKLPCCPDPGGGTDHFGDTSGGAGPETGLWLLCRAGRHPGWRRMPGAEPPGAEPPASENCFLQVAAGCWPSVVGGMVLSTIWLLRGQRLRAHVLLAAKHLGSQACQLPAGKAMRKRDHWTDAGVTVPGRQSTQLETPTHGCSDAGPSETCPLPPNWVTKPPPAGSHRPRRPLPVPAPVSPELSPAQVWRKQGLPGRGAPTL